MLTGKRYSRKTVEEISPIIVCAQYLDAPLPKVVDFLPTLQGYTDLAREKRQLRAETDAT
jgi:hypothetical protein